MLGDAADSGLKGGGRDAAVVVAIAGGHRVFSTPYPAQDELHEQHGY